MKKILPMLIIVAIAVMLQGYVFEYGKENTVMSSDSLFIVYNNDLFSGFTAYPDANGHIEIDVPDTVAVIALYSYPRTLYRVYAVKENSNCSSFALIGEIFYDNDLPDSAHYYYLKAFNEDSYSNNAYKGLLKIADDMGNDSLLFYMNQYMELFRDNKTVILENAMQYRKMDNDSMYRTLLMMGSENPEISHSYLMILVYALYADIEINRESLVFALKHFSDNENLSYIIDYVGSNDMFDEMKEIIHALTGDDVNNDNMLSAAILMMDEQYETETAYSVISTLINKDVFPEYKGYLYYKLATGDIYSGNYEQAKLNFGKAEEFDTYRDEEYFMFKFTVDSFFGDSQSMLNDAMNVIAMNYTDSTLLMHMDSYSRYADASGREMLIDILKSEIEDMPRLDFTLKDINEEQIQFSDFNGILFIDCFTSWCSYCKMAMPLILEMGEENPEMDIIGISSEKTSGDLAEYVNEKNIEFPVLYDGASVYNDLSVNGVPNMLLMDINTQRMFRLVGYSSNLKEYFYLRYRYLKGEI